MSHWSLLTPVKNIKNIKRIVFKIYTFIHLSSSLLRLNVYEFRIKSQLPNACLISYTYTSIVCIFWVLRELIKVLLLGLCVSADCSTNTILIKYCTFTHIFTSKQRNSSLRRYARIHLLQLLTLTTRYVQ